MAENIKRDAQDEAVEDLAAEALTGKESDKVKGGALASASTLGTGAMDPTNARGMDPTNARAMDPTNARPSGL